MNTVLSPEEYELYDAAAFAHALNSGEKILPLFKKTIKAANEKQVGLYRMGVSVTTLVLLRALCR